MAGNAAFVGQVPEFYDRGLGPFLFEHYAQEMAARAAALKPARVLETAAGTGIVTQRLRKSLPRSAELTATDLNAPMLEVAKAKFGADSGVAFAQADAQELSFADSSFDAVVCQFGIMFYPDKPKSFRETRRVLAPGGTYLFSVWDAHAYNPFGRIVHEVAARFFPKDPPPFYKIPFGTHSIDAVKTMLHEAGFGGIKVEVLAHDSPVADLSFLARSAVFGNPFGDQVKERGGDPEAVIAAIEKDLAAAFGTRPRPIPMQTIFFAASKAR